MMIIKKIPFKCVGPPGAGLDTPVKGQRAGIKVKPGLSSCIKHMLSASQTGNNVMLTVSCRLWVIDDDLWWAAPGLQTLQK